MADIVATGIISALKRMTPGPSKVPIARPPVSVPSPLVTPSGLPDVRRLPEAKLGPYGTALKRLLENRSGFGSMSPQVLRDRAARRKAAMTTPFAPR